VQSIASIHELLYRSDSFSSIKLAAYARQIVPGLIRFYGLQETIEVTISGEDAFLELERAVPYGLLLNELVSNSCKHAFASRKSGTLSISFEHHEREIEVTVTDNGVGLPAGFDYQRANSLGLQLVRNLARQLRGTVQIESSSGNGTVVRVSFPDAQATVDPNSDARP
jgi:two-component sensor histidine kinase